MTKQHAGGAPWGASDQTDGVIAALTPCPARPYHVPTRTMDAFPETTLK
jgi:hypothetical protein